jgi:Prp8 binding protein
MALGHQGAVMELHWTTDGEHILTASTDKTAGLWDASACERLRRLKGHSAIVNSVCPARNDPHHVVTGSDDTTVRVRACCLFVCLWFFKKIYKPFYMHSQQLTCAQIWDTRKRHFANLLEAKYPVTAVCFSADGTQAISGGVDNVVRVWDLRNNQVLHALEGHTGAWVCPVELLFSVPGV